MQDGKSFDDEYSRLVSSTDRGQFADDIEVPREIGQIRLSIKGWERRISQTAYSEPSFLFGDH